MNIENYLNQLIDDLNVLLTEPPPFRARQAVSLYDADDEECITERLMEFEDHALNQKGELIHAYTGITKANLPDPEYLTDEQVDLLLDSIMELFDHFQFYPDFREEIPNRIRYQKIRELWNEFKAPLIDCQLHYDFCDYEEDSCPFPGICKGCEENDSILEDTITDAEDDDGIYGIAGSVDDRLERLKKRIMSKGGNQYIRGIHNYCDRWCARCSLRKHCVIYDPLEEKEFNEGRGSNLDLSWGVSWEEERKQEFQHVKKMVEEKMEELDISPYELAENEGFSIVEREGIRLKPESRKVLTISECYSKTVNNWLEIEGYENVEKELDFIGIFETIHWYCVMVTTKIFRSLLPDLDEFEIGEDEVQSDCNGSAKVAIKSIMQSLYAWSWVILNKPQYKKVGITLAILLIGMLEGMQSFFPRAEEFVRPGFDQPEEEWELS